MDTRGAHTNAWNGELPGEPESAGVARRLVTDLLRSWGHDSRVDTARLLVSEVVTNAILHAGSDIALRVTGGTDSVRVEVGDGSAAFPSPRPWGGESVTGHGLELVELLSSSWGVDAVGPGKWVWFELGVERRVSAEQAAGLFFGDGLGHEHTVRFRDLPTGLALASFQYDDALLRELALLNLVGDPVSYAPSTDPGGRLDLSGLVSHLADAVARGRARVDLDVELPARSADAALDRLALVDEAERLAADGLLLALPALPEVSACRRWLLGEVALQVQGAGPTPWVLPDSTGGTDLTDGLDTGDLEAIDPDVDGVVVADHHNRIVYADATAADLLGWSRDDLVGYRLTALIPPELREAHLGGFTRFQLTGESRILGTWIEVPALRRDRARITVRLLIEPLSHPDGQRRLFRARVEPANEPGSGGPAR